MKKSLLYLLLITLLVFFVSACSSDDIVNQEDDASTYDTYIIVRADAGDGQVTLEWTYESSASTYNIYYIQAATKPTYDDLKANGTKIVGADATPNIISAPCVVPGLENDKKYWFSITGVNSSGVEYNLATPTEATPTSPAPLPAPENVRANAGNEKVTVTWTPVTGADYYVIECYWQEGTTADVGYVIVAGGYTGSQVVDSGSITWTIDTAAGIINDRTYYFDVCAMGNGTDTISETDDDIQSSASFTVWATPSNNPPPSAPTNLFVQEVGNGVVNLWWDDVAGATSYDVYIGTAKNMRKDEYQYWYKIVGPSAVNPPDSGIIITELENDTTYYFIVTAIDNRGTTDDTSDDLESAESNEVSATPTAP